MHGAPDIAAAVALALAATWTMVYAGARKRMLDLRHRRRRCPSCGHALAGGRACARH